jgi:hypothetical protein
MKQSIDPGCPPWPRRDAAIITRVEGNEGTRTVWIQSLTFGGRHVNSAGGYAFQAMARAQERVAKRWSELDREGLIRELEKLREHLKEGTAPGEEDVP